MDAVDGLAFRCFCNEEGTREVDPSNGCCALPTKGAVLDTNENGRER